MMVSSLRSLLTMPGILWWGLDVWMGALLELLAISLQKQQVRSKYHRLFLVFGYHSCRAVLKLHGKIRGEMWCRIASLPKPLHIFFHNVTVWNRQMNINSYFDSGTLTVNTDANSIFFTPTLSQPSRQWLISFPPEMGKWIRFHFFLTDW